MLIWTILSSVIFWHHDPFKSAISRGNWVIQANVYALDVSIWKIDKILKEYVRCQNHLECSIVESYVIEEAVEFYS